MSASFKQRFANIPPGVWALGFVSMLMDISSEMIHALLPIYMVTVLGTSTLAVGLIEGIAEATAAFTKIFSGVLSDRLGRRKELAVLGYGLGAVTKPVFPLAASLSWIVAARFIDRIGKGIRGAPRDALVADLTPPEARGAAFGLRQALDTVGAFLGPLLAIGLMLVTANDFKTVFWIAVVPAFLALLLMAFGVHDPNRPAQARKAEWPLSRTELLRLGPAYWRVVVIATIFTLARFSDAFLVLRAQSAGLPVALIPAVMVVMNVVYAAVAYPAGALSDRIGRYKLLGSGMIILILADVVLATSSSVAGVAWGVVLWGAHMGVTQGLLSALIADTAPAELRGTAFGMFSLATGIALLAASTLAGGLWDALGPKGTFLAGAAFASLAAAALLMLPHATSNE